MVNGDVYDIGQTVNGISRFLWFNDEWYYFEQRSSSKYGYDQDDLTKLILENEFDEVKLLGNIFVKLDIIKLLGNTIDKFKEKKQIQ
jgi:hypothetical protein